MAQHPPVNRRTLVTAAAWTAPAAALAAPTPAFAASPGQVVTDHGLFVHPVDQTGSWSSGNRSLYLNTSLATGRGPAAEGDLNWSDTNTTASPYGSPTVASTADGWTLANGEGSFTPGGTMETTINGPTSYGGTGLWISAPRNRVTNAFIEGATTRLPSGSTFTLTFEITTFSAAGTTNNPSEWARTNNYLAAATPVNSNRESWSAVALTVTWGTPTTSGAVRTLPTTLRTSAAMTATGAASPYNQILFSQMNLTYTGSVARSIKSVKATLTMNPTNLEMYGFTEAGTTYTSTNPKRVPVTGSQTSFIIAPKSA